MTLNSGMNGGGGGGGGGGVKSVSNMLATDATGSAYGLIMLGGAGADQAFNILIPDDFSSLVSVVVHTIGGDGAPGETGDIELTGSWTADSGDIGTNLIVVPSVTWSMPGFDFRFDVDASSAFTGLTSASAGALLGLAVERNAGTTSFLWLLGITLKYNAT